MNRGIVSSSRECHILFTICDHFEPFWNKVDYKTAQSRVEKWVDNYPKIAQKHKDALGNSPKYCFFYPIEEYDRNFLDQISDICKHGIGETEIHLHHHNDTPENLKKTLIDFKKRLYEEHGLLCRNRKSKDIQYGFIHGNWALDNSRPDGQWCGVNNEISILQETGCYADFTMPSAPSDTQTRKINDIYYATDDPERPKSHDTGQSAEAGKTDSGGLLCIQGPLCFNLKKRKFGIIPKIENGDLSSDMGFSAARIQLWADQRIHVKGRPDIIFIKVYTHGTQEKNMHYFFDQGKLEKLYSEIEDFCLNIPDCKLYYVSARQMYNVVKGLEVLPNASVPEIFDHELVLQSTSLDYITPGEFINNSSTIIQS